MNFFSGNYIPSHGCIVPRESSPPTNHQILNLTSTQFSSNKQSLIQPSAKPPAHNTTWECLDSKLRLTHPHHPSTSAHTATPNTKLKASSTSIFASLNSSNRLNFKALEPGIPHNLPLIPFKSATSQTNTMSTPPNPNPTDIPRHKILTQHCRFCNHLLLATTRTLASLPRRTGESKDAAIILPLESKTQTQTASSQHTTVLLSTTIPDRRATLIRREDGIEKRILLRCGRCRVVVGYYLDKVHWGKESKPKPETEAEIEDGDEADAEERPPAVYILPGAVVETAEMGTDGGVGEMEWRVWGE